MHGVLTHRLNFKGGPTFRDSRKLLARIVGVSERTASRFLTKLREGELILTREINGQVSEYSLLVAGKLAKVQNDVTAGRKYFLVPDVLLSRPDLSLGAVVLWSYLVNRLGKENHYCWPKEAEISSDLGISSKTLRKHLHALEHAGMLHRKPRDETVVQRGQGGRWDFYPLSMASLSVMGEHRQNCPDPGQNCHDLPVILSRPVGNSVSLYNRSSTESLKKEKQGEERADAATPLDRPSLPFLSPGESADNPPRADVAPTAATPPQGDRADGGSEDHPSTNLAVSSDSAGRSTQRTETSSTPGHGNVNPELELMDAIFEIDPKGQRRAQLEPIMKSEFRSLRHLDEALLLALRRGYTPDDLKRVVQKAKDKTISEDGAGGLILTMLKKGQKVDLFQVEEHPVYRVAAEHLEYAMRKLGFDFDGDFAGNLRRHVRKWAPVLNSLLRIHFTNATALDLLNSCLIAGNAYGRFEPEQVVEKPAAAFRILKDNMAKFERVLADCASRTPPGQSTPTAPDFTGCPQVFTEIPVKVSGSCSLGTPQHSFKPGEFEQLLRESMQRGDKLREEERQSRRVRYTGRALCNQQLENEIINVERVLSSEHRDIDMALAISARIEIQGREFEIGIAKPDDWSDDDQTDREEMENRLKRLNDRYT